MAYHPLPDYSPKTEVVEALGAGKGRFSYGQTFHPIVKAPDGRLVVDVWVRPGGKTMVRLWRREDHPNLSVLPVNAPRKVKALYRADGQLAYLRSSEYWTNPLKLAIEAWEEYHAQLNKHFKTKGE